MFLLISVRLYVAVARSFVDARQKLNQIFIPALARTTVTRTTTFNKFLFLSTLCFLIYYAVYHYPFVISSSRFSFSSTSPMVISDAIAVDAPLINEVNCRCGHP